MTERNRGLYTDANGHIALYGSDGKWVRAGRIHLLDWAVGYDNGCQTTMHYVDDFQPCDDPENEHVKALKKEIREHGQYRAKQRNRNHDIN